MKHWPLKDIYFWEAAPFFRLLLPLIAGIVCYGFIAVPLSAMVAILAISAAISIATAFFHKQVVLQWLFNIALYLSLFSAAWLSSYYNDVKNDTAYFGHSTKAEAFLVKAISQPVAKERTYKLKVSVIGALDGNHLSNARGDAFLYIYKDQQPLTITKGDSLMIPATWQPVTNTGNPYEFDYTAYCARNNIYYQQFASINDIVMIGKGNATQQGYTDKVHDYCMQSLSRYIKDKKVMGLLQSMLIGDEANLDTELRQAYAETGIIHIIAISGSHISFFFVLIAFLLGWIKHRKYHWLKYVLALPLIWFYVLMAGGSPSAVRAAVMFTILAIGFALQKKPNSLNQLFATAFILLLVQPMWLYSIGFQLSFLAVLSLILFYRPIYKLWQPQNRITRMLWACVTASLAAEILVAPLVIHYFHLFPTMFIIANVAAFVFMGLVLIAGMLIIALSWWPFAAAGIAGITTWLATVFHNLVYLFQHCNPPSFRFLSLLPYETILVYIIIAGIAIAIIKKQKPAVFMGLLATCLLLVSFCHNEWIALRQDKLIVYNLSRTTHIERIAGKRHIVIESDTAIVQTKRDYAVKPAHTALHAWKQTTGVAGSEILYIGNATILVLNRPIQAAESFPVDYMVVNYDMDGNDAGGLIKTFNPKKMILSSRFTRKKLEEVLTAFQAENQPVHAVSKQGAFVLSAL